VAAFAKKAAEHANVQSAATKILEGVRPLNENETVRYFVFKDLFAIDKGLWRGCVDFMNKRIRRPGYKLVENVTPENVLGRLNVRSTPANTVIFISQKDMEGMSDTDLATLWKHATLVGHDTVGERSAVYVGGLMAYAEGLRSIDRTESMDTDRDILGNMTQLTNAYKAITGGADLNITWLKELYDWGYSRERLMKKGVRITFPKIEPELRKWMLEYQRQRLNELITEINV